MADKVKSFLFIVVLSVAVGVSVHLGDYGFAAGLAMFIVMSNGDMIHETLENIEEKQP